MNTRPVDVINPALLFRFATPWLKLQGKNHNEKSDLAPTYTLPAFHELNHKPQVAEVRSGWSEEGLLFQVSSLPSSKNQPVSLKRFRLWIDTRPGPDVIRGTQYCHAIANFFDRFAHDLDLRTPHQFHVRPIDRAREAPTIPPPGSIKSHYLQNAKGYQLKLWIPHHALTGYDTSDFREFGLFYETFDSNQVTQPFSHASSLCYSESPSSWIRMQCTDSLPHCEPASNDLS